MLVKIRILLFLWNVHEQVKDSLFSFAFVTNWEIVLNVSGDAVRSAEVFGIPICISLPVFQIVITFISVFQKSVKEINRQYLNMFHFLKSWNVYMWPLCNIQEYSIQEENISFNV